MNKSYVNMLLKLNRHGTLMLMIKNNVYNWSIKDFEYIYNEIINERHFVLYKFYFEYFHKVNEIRIHHKIKDYPYNQHSSDDFLSRYNYTKDYYVKNSFEYSIYHGTLNHVKYVLNNKNKSKCKAKIHDCICHWSCHTLGTYYDDDFIKMREYDTTYVINNNESNENNIDTIKYLTSNEFTIKYKNIYKNTYHYTTEIKCIGRNNLKILKYCTSPYYINRFFKNYEKSSTDSLLSLDITDRHSTINNHRFLDFIYNFCNSIDDMITIRNYGIDTLNYIFSDYYQTIFGFDISQVTLISNINELFESYITSIFTFLCSKYYDENRDSTNDKKYNYKKIFKEQFTNYSYSDLMIYFHKMYHNLTLNDHWGEINKYELTKNYSKVCEIFMFQFLLEKYFNNFYTALMKENFNWNVMYDETEQNIVCECDNDNFYNNMTQYNIKKYKYVKSNIYIF